VGLIEWAFQMYWREGIFLRERLVGGKAFFEGKSSRREGNILREMLVGGNDIVGKG
jgi:hypothetical protein